MENNEVFEENTSLEEITLVLAHTEDRVLIDRFLQSILTKKEIEEIASRWELVKLIDEGVSQRKIAQRLGLSLCKITRGSKELKKKDSAFAKFIEQYRSLMKQDEEES